MRTSPTPPTVRELRYEQPPGRRQGGTDMRRFTTALADLKDRSRAGFKREWHSFILAVGVAVLVPVFAISVLALPPSVYLGIVSHALFRM